MHLVKGAQKCAARPDPQGSDVYLRDLGVPSSNGSKAAGGGAYKSQRLSVMSRRSQETPQAVLGGLPRSILRRVGNVTQNPLLPSLHEPGMC